MRSQARRPTNPLQATISPNDDESGQFIDAQSKVFTRTFLGSGSAAGPVILGGVRVPIGRYGAGFEIRHQSAEGKLTADQTFAGDLRASNREKFSSEIRCA